MEKKFYNRGVMTTNGTMLARSGIRIYNHLHNRNNRIMVKAPLMGRVSQ